MKKVNPLILGIFFAAILLTSCKKYEEGGQVRKAEKNLTALKWNFDKYLRNGSDETTLVLFRELFEEYNEGGEFVRRYIDDEGELEVETGAWSLEDKKKEVSVSNISSLEVTDEAGTVSSSAYNIVKLTKDEYWYSFENGGATHEFHFTAN